MNIAIIPARKDSQGIKNKNLVVLAGKPLIAYSIQTALACKAINKVIVSTDSPAIANISKKFGAWVPFLRPRSLAKADTPLLPVLIHCLEFIERILKTRINNLILLDPTSPFRNNQDILKCLKLIEKPKTDSVVTVCEAEHNPYFVMRKIKDNYLVSLIKPKKELTRRQDAPKVYRINAGVYVIKRDVLLSGKIFTPHTRAVMMPQVRSIHIDQLLDLQIAQFLIEKKYVKF